MTGVEVASAYVTLMPSMKNFQRNLEKEFKGVNTGKAGETAGKGFASKFTGTVTSTLGRWAKRATVVGIGATIGGSIAGGINRMMKIEDAEAKLKGLGHSAEDVARIMGKDGPVLAAVRGTAFGLDEAATAAATAMAAGVDSGKELEKYLSLVGDAATIANVSMGEMGSIFGKVQTNQRAYTAELNQLADRGIPIYQWLQKEYGVTAEELRKMVSDGKVDADTYFKVIDDNIGGAALTAGDTTRGALKNMGAAWSRFGETLISEAYPYFKDVFTASGELADRLSGYVGPAMETVSDAITGMYDLIVKGDFTSKLREVFGFEEDSGLVVFILDARDALTKFIDEFKNGSGAGGEFRDVLEELWQSIKDTGVFIRDDVLPRLREFGEWLVDNKGKVAAFAGTMLTFKAAMDIKDVADGIAKNGGVVKSLTTWALKLDIVKNAQKAWNTVIWLTQGAQKALNLVMKMSPLGRIISVITLLVGAFVTLYKTNETFRNFVDKAWATIKDTIVGVWENWIKPTFKAIKDWITDTLVPTFTGFWQNTIVPVWDGIVNAISTAWGWVEPIFKSVYSFVADVLTAAFLIFTKLVEVAWKTIWAVIKGSWENWILPVFQALSGWIRDTLIPWFTRLWEKVRDVWTWVSDKITAAWNRYIQPIFDTIWKWLKDTLGPIFQTFWEKVRDVWTWIANKVQDGWDRTIKVVFDAMRDGVDKVKAAFESARDGIGRAWDALRQIVAKPIVAVIGFVNNGIIDSINTVLDWAGLSKIKHITVPTGLRNAANGWFTSPSGGRTGGNTRNVARAMGGVLPGYSPGFDDMHFFGVDGSTLSLAGGEAVMRPEWTRAVGRDWIDRMNYAARTGGVQGVQKAMSFARGGVVEDKGGGVFPEWLTNVVSWPLNKAKSVLERLFGKHLDRLTNNPWFDVAKGLVGKMLTKSVEKIRSLFAPSTEGGEFSANGMAVNYGGNLGWAPRGLPWQAIWGLIKQRAPEARKTSDYRPGAVTASGYPSLHGQGRAVDIVSGNMAQTFMKIRPLLRWSQLFYSPMGNLQYGYRDAIVHRTHFDHIHAALAKGGIVPTLYDSGGWLQPGVSLVANNTNKPEAILTDKQLADLKGGDTHVTLYGVPMDTAGETADAVMYQLRRVNRGKYAGRR